MVYGPLRRNRGLPVQDFDLILLLADRFDRSTQAQALWAEQAKLCVEFVEGKQWTDGDLAKLLSEDRPALTFNKINPLIRLVMGYHRNNRTDEKYLPGHDAASTAMVAEAITKTAKQMSEQTQQPWIDAEVFQDGIITGRGYYDWRLDFEKNELGEARAIALDPFAVYLDPDGDQYDLNDSTYWFYSRWSSLEDIEQTYSLQARELVEPLLTGGHYTGLPASLTEYAEEITPFRKFGGQEEDFIYSTFGPLQGFLHNLIDAQRRTIRVLEMQHYKRVMTRVVIDLETGVKKHIPDHWNDEKLLRFLSWSEEQFAAKGKASPMRFDERMERRVRWTTMVGDFLVWDDWSPYETFTLTPYFPYFRRGKTRGMVEDLIDPQREINKRRSAQVDQVTRTANSGWLLHEKSLDDEQDRNWIENSAAPGFIGKWKGEQSWMKPERIQQAAQPLAAERLEDKSAQDLKDISGVNDSLLGTIDKVQSGRAIEARQRQGVLSIQTYMDNMSRTRELVGRKKLELIQNHYTEQRIIRTVAESGSQDELIINQRDIAGIILNNVSVGIYSIFIDETPMSETFLQAQFEDLMTMIKEGAIPLPIVMDILVDASTVPQKEVIKTRLTAFMKMQGIPIGDEAGSVPGAAVPLATQGAKAAAGSGAPLVAAGGMTAVPGGAAPAAPQMTPGMTTLSGGNVIPLGPRGVPNTTG